MVFEHVMEQLGLTPRAQQVKLVGLIRNALSSESQLMAQAGTGTGKSYAILSTALEAAQVSGQTSIVVCPNNALIDQYVGKDVPSVRGVAGGQWAHIKGRSHYVCASSAALFTDREPQKRYFDLIANGELEWANLGLDSEWACPGSKRCDPYDYCHHVDFCNCPPACGAIQAKRNAEGVDVVVTNAHVLFWDYLVRGFTAGAVGLLPEYAALFVDECHELESIGRACLSEEIKETSKVVGLIPGLKDWINRTRDRLLDADCQESLLDRDGEVTRMADDAVELATEIANRGELTKQERSLVKRLTNFAEFVSESENHISIIDVGDPLKVALRRVCVNAGAEFNELLTAQPSVLVSGTIPGSDRRRLGLGKQTVRADVGHPFDYSQSRLLISKYDPTDPFQVHHRIKSVVRAINETNGGTLILFTSWSDVESTMPRVAAGLNPGIDVYVQSREDPTSLKADIADFRADGNAVLAGVRSLFTGLDIPGPALRQVILWKLPYQVPTLEVQAIQAIYGRGVYRDQMLMIMAQGIGRLIRSVDDRGRVLIMDNRAKSLAWDTNPMTYHLAEFGS